MKSKDDEILKMEVFVLKRFQKSKHVCRLLLACKGDTYKWVWMMEGREITRTAYFVYSFMVMTLLGKELSELRRRMPDRKLSQGTGLKIGVQMVQVN